VRGTRFAEQVGSIVKDQIVKLTSPQASLLPGFEPPLAGCHEATGG
jgi:hypothetical protein